MKAPFLLFSSVTPSNLRYTVYLSETKKRLFYVGVSFLLAFYCAYTQRVSLMYSTTLSLQKALSPGKTLYKQNGGERFSPFFETIKEDASSFLKESNTRLSVVAERPASLTYPLRSFEETHVMQSKTDMSQPFDAKQGFAAHEIDLQNLVLQTTPANESVRLIFTNVEEAFYTLLCISLFYCFLTCFPVLLYQVFCFFQPGFYAWQSKRIGLFLSLRVLLAYLVLKIVDLFVIQRLLRFFYSFQIQRDSLCLHAETKVISYVSLYVFIHFVTVMLLVVIWVWTFYKQRQILGSLLSPHSLPKNYSFMALSSRYLREDMRQTHSLSKHKDLGEDRYESQRSKVWWGCLLLAAFLSPPEIFSQLAYTILLILFSEISVWLAYISSCRLYNKMAKAHVGFTDDSRYDI